MLLAAPAAPAAPPSTVVGPGTIASVLLFPAGLRTSTPCDATLSHDLGCNAWLGRDDSWATYEAVRGPMLATLRGALGAAPLATAWIYFPAFLADEAAHGAAPLQRLAAVARDVAAAGMRPALFFGRPEFFGAGNASDARDVVHSAAARDYLLARVAAALALPDVRANVGLVSLYWVGAASFCASGGCSEADIAAFTAAAQAAVHASGPGFRYLQHVDGPFWDSCWPQPCQTWGGGGGVQTANTSRRAARRMKPRLRPRTIPRSRTSVAACPASSHST